MTRRDDDENSRYVDENAVPKENGVLVADPKKRRKSSSSSRGGRNKKQKKVVDISAKVALTKKVSDVFGDYFKGADVTKSRDFVVVAAERGKRLAVDAPYVRNRYECVKTKTGDVHVAKIVSDDDSSVRFVACLPGNETILGNVADEHVVFETNRKTTVLKTEILERYDVDSFCVCNQRYDEIDGRFTDAFSEFPEKAPLRVVPGTCVSLDETVSYDDPKKDLDLVLEINENAAREIEERRNDPETYSEFWRKRSDYVPLKRRRALGTMFVESVADSAVTGILMWRPSQCFGENEIERYERELIWSFKRCTLPLSVVKGVWTIDLGTKRDDEEYDFFCYRGYDERNDRATGIPKNLPRGPAAPPPPPKKEKISVADFFSGAGGLSIGFDWDDRFETKWAFEYDADAASTFETNHPETIVYRDDVNDVLRVLVDGGSESPSGKTLPKPGDIGAIVGGPPCQGFSGMNVFSHNETNRLKSSLVATYLSFCDFYGPNFFLLENVRTFSTQDDGVVLRLCLKTLIRLGYQCCVGVLQAAGFGVPQSRRRTIIMASKYDVPLPRHPFPKYSTDCGNGRSTRIRLNEIYVDPTRGGTDNEISIYQNVRVGDAFSDLPRDEGVDRYVRDPSTDVQRRSRKRVAPGRRLENHESIKFKTGFEKRARLVPNYPTADWRDLPNVDVLDDDGTIALRRLVYFCDAEERKKRRDGGVGKESQPRTTINWCLAHGGKASGHFNGLNGRVNWYGIASTVACVPGPVSKQGRVLAPHPDPKVRLNRVLTVAEYARLQGFPDHYVFRSSDKTKRRSRVDFDDDVYDDEEDDEENGGGRRGRVGRDEDEEEEDETTTKTPLRSMYRQIGNAVPVNLGRALANAVFECA